METIKEPSYWWIDTNLPEEEQVVSAICIECQKNKKLQAWYWDGDYVDDLNCKLCNKIIYKQETDE